jgi:hypothetical protein
MARPILRSCAVGWSRRSMLVRRAGKRGNVSGERQHGHRVGGVRGFKVRRLEHGLPEWAAGLPVDTDSEHQRVRSGSISEVGARNREVRFTPKIRHRSPGLPSPKSCQQRT